MPLFTKIGWIVACISVGIIVLAYVSETFYLRPIGFILLFMGLLLVGVKVDIGGSHGDHESGDSGSDGGE